MSYSVEVPVTMVISVSFPDGEPTDVTDATAAIAARAAEHFAHVSHARIAAFNEVNRIHPVGAGVIETVSSAVRTPLEDAA